MNIKNRLPEYFVEFVIIVFGISLSFILNEWRKERETNQAEITALTDIRSDLAVDTTTISKELDLMTQYMSYYAYFQKNYNNTKANKDSIVQAINTFANYTTFEANNVSFEQLKASGQLNLISNKKVLKKITGIYVNQYKNVKEYLYIDRKMVLDQILPYMIKEAAISFVNLYRTRDLLSSKPYKQLVNDSVFQNLFIINASFKRQSQQRYLTLLTQIKQTVDMINEELKRLQ